MQIWFYFQFFLIIKLGIVYLFNMSFTCYKVSNGINNNLIVQII